MKITKSQLDTPFSQIIEGAENNETPREFIRNCEEEFGMYKKVLEILSDEELNFYIDELGELWEK